MFRFEEVLRLWNISKYIARKEKPIFNARSVTGREHAS